MSRKQPCTYPCGSCQETNCGDIENTCDFSDEEENESK